MKRILLFVISCSLFLSRVNGQTENFPSGSYIINMGSSTQTISNGLKPYGLIYELLKTYHVPVKWIIGQGKMKDAKDFTYSSINYKGGTFVISADYITSAVSARISAWSTAGVVGNYTTNALNLNVTKTLTSVPNWTLNPVNVAISKSFFTDAGIPSSAYTMANANGLGACNDIFVMPHADPTWANHGNLYNWNRNYIGAIWAGCHAVSVLESLVNPSNASEQMNFLSTKGLINYNSHNDGSAPFSYFFNRGNYNGAPISARPDDAVFQMIGSEDAAHTNGSEQVYIPSSGSSWRNTTHIGCYDSIQSNVNANASNGPAAVTMYGRGFGLNTSGYVMYQGGHDIEGSNEANIAAVRQFFNFSLMVMTDKVPSIANLNVPAQIQEGTTYNISVNASSPVGSTLTYQWSASCPGVFGNTNSASTTFTPSSVNKNSTYTITCIVTDGCSRYSFNSNIMTGMAALPVTIINFNSTQNENNIVVNWSTSQEENLRQFKLYRSFNGSDYFEISEINTHSNNQDIKNYEYIDLNAQKLGGTSVYYKLKSINNDGSYQWSYVIKHLIAKSKLAAEHIKLFPNPCIDETFIEITESSENPFTIEVIDSRGQSILKDENPLINNNSYKVDMSKLEKGIYFIILNFEDGSKTSNKLIKR